MGNRNTYGRQHETFSHPLRPSHGVSARELTLTQERLALHRHVQRQCGSGAFHCLSVARPTIVAAGAMFKAIVTKNVETRTQSPNHAASLQANELPSNIKTSTRKSQVNT